jgi:hypothetical protein
MTNYLTLFFGTLAVLNCIVALDARLSETTITTERRLLELTIVGDEPSAESAPLGECEGNCVFDSHCDAGLICWRPDAGDSVPGCEGNAIGNYCVVDQNRGRSGANGASVVSIQVVTPEELENENQAQEPANVVAEVETADQESA